MEGNQEVYEINLIDLMFYCLKKWRWIVICMVVFAIAAGVYKYQAAITDNQAKKEELLQRSKHPAAEQAEGGTAGEAESEPIVLENPVSSAVSFAAVGMIGGACLVCLIFCMRYVMSGKLQSERDFQRKFGMPLLGIVRKKDTKKKILGFVDRWIRRLEEGPYAKIPRKEQIKIAAVNIQNAIHKNQDEKIRRGMMCQRSVSSWRRRSRMLHFRLTDRLCSMRQRLRSWNIMKGFSLSRRRGNPMRS